jgi:hypothetical protein
MCDNCQNYKPHKQQAGFVYGPLPDKPKWAWEISEYCSKIIGGSKCQYLPKDQECTVDHCPFYTGGWIFPANPNWNWSEPKIYEAWLAWKEKSKTIMMGIDMADTASWVTVAHYPDNTFKIIDKGDRT